MVLTAVLGITVLLLFLSIVVMALEIDHLERRINTTDALLNTYDLAYRNEMSRIEHKITDKPEKKRKYKRRILRKRRLTSKDLHCFNEIKALWDANKKDAVDGTVLVRLPIMGESVKDDKNR